MIRRPSQVAHYGTMRWPMPYLDASPVRFLQLWHLTPLFNFFLAALLAHLLIYMLMVWDPCLILSNAFWSTPTFGYGPADSGSDASSIKSSGADSTFSFYSAVNDAGRLAKRRHADVSRLGVPKWYSGDPPPAPDMPGTAPPSEMPQFTMAHSKVMPAADVGAEPWLGVVLYSQALPTSPVAMYHNAAKIAGEVRMVLKKPAQLSSIDVWFVLTETTVHNVFTPPGLTMTACLWNRKQGHPTAMGAEGDYKGKFPAGTYVFPFEFPALPADTVVKHPGINPEKHKGRVPLPPTYSVGMVGGFSGDINYTVGVNFTRDGLGSVDDEFDMRVQYLPLSRPLPRLKTPFPYLPTREDWPFAREVVGGWTLTPFGGRGRLGEQVVEIEGILGIQEPAVYTAGETLEFSLLLWSASPLALEALAQPGAIDVGYYKSDLSDIDALDPTGGSRDRRKLERLASGLAWLADAGKPAEDAPAPECALVDLTTPAGGRDDATLTDNTSGVVRLDGAVRVPACSHPSFRYASIAREYLLLLVINHPQHAHISPKAARGIVAEVPVWYILNRSGSGPKAVHSDLPVKGATIPVGEDVVRMPGKMGHVTTQVRPTTHTIRLAAF
ncbi:hypothetical protein B0H17DRAFT_200082 [Mycena rosella]|uniref:Uncharacterized protein n=1 Tax=Mycena rosella TaxID=1033263 RepID=A0AAD7DW80_MYCRO|nr:hypothetical protein B0H17DRAFT_200082 [Mycena rosella]